MHQVRRTGKFEFELTTSANLHTLNASSLAVEVVARSTDGGSIQDTNVGSHSFAIVPDADPATVLNVGPIPGVEDLYNFISKADILSQITINGTQEQIHSIHIATVPEGMTAPNV